MRNLTTWIYISVFLAMVLMVAQGDAQFPATPEHGAIMERKLQAAHRVLAGIAREDFKGIEKEAQKLRLLSQEAAWNVVQTPEYSRLSIDFRNTTDQLTQAALEENLDAAGLAYVKLSISCIDCHRHARKELSRIGRKPLRVKSTSSLLR